MPKILIVTQTDPHTDMVYEKWGEYGYDAAIMFKEKRLLFRVIRRIWLLCRFPFGQIWCGNWVNSLDQYEVIILHSNNLSGFLPPYLEKRYPHLRIIYWYWNKVGKYTDPGKIKHDRTEFWSFNKCDCSKYGMKYNIQYYYDVSKEENDIANQSDIFFIGHDHGRKEQIEKVKAMAQRENLKCDFRLISSDQKNIPYKNVRKMIKTTKAILEINQSNQDGYTLRTLESLFFGKKLITDNKGVGDLPFYNINNMYILGYDTRNLREFVYGKYDDGVSVFWSKYDIDAWIGNFFKKDQEI